MSNQSLGTVNWGTAPTIPVAISCEYKRSGSSMLYRIRLTLAAISGETQFADPIYLDLKLDGSSTVNGYTVKEANVAQWDNAITYDSGWMTVYNKLRGDTALAVRLYNGAARDTTYRYSLPVSTYFDLLEWLIGGGSSDTSTVENRRPSASLAVSIQNTNATVAGWGICVQGMSRLHYSITAQPQEDAVISGYLFSFSGQTMPDAVGTTGEIESAGTLTPVATVTDSNGLSTTVSGEAITVYPYNPPRIRTSSVVRCNADGEEQDDGAWLKVSGGAECSSLNGNNSVTLRARYRSRGGVYGGYSVISGDIPLLLGGNLDSHTTYEVEFSATDAVGQERSVCYTTTTAAVTLHLRAGGDGAAFGKYAEQEGLECLWDAAFDGDVAIGGTLSASSVTLNGTALLEKVYPVGAVYISTTGTNPGTLFGGTWETIRGKFLLAESDAHAALSDGGTETHTLSVSEMAPHNHPASAEIAGRHGHAFSANRSGGSSGSTAEGSGSSDAYYAFDTSQEGAHTHTITVGNTGGGTAFSIMPPYLAVYMWKRVS